MTHTAPAPRHLPTGSRRSDIARRARAAARTAEQTHPALGTPGHLRDAARSLERGNTEAAKRHLRAAMNLYTPVSLYRHGVDDDEGHTAARQGLAVAHRLHLQVQEVEDTEARNRQREALPKDGPSFSPRAIEGLPTGSPGGARGNQAMNAPARENAGRDRNVAGGPEAPSAHPGTALSWDAVSQAVELAARTWDDVARAVDLAVPTWDGVARQIDLSARTGMLAVTPAPYGKPGGPGLYGKKGNKHSDYFEQVVQALMRKRGMDKGHASAIAWSALRKWRAKSKHPEVRAAATGALAEEAVAGAKAAGHSNTWAAVELAISNAVGWGAVELAVASVIDLYNPQQQRVPKGQPGGGQFGSGKQGGKQGGKAGSSASRARQKAELLARARADRTRARALAAQIRALQAAQRKSNTATRQATKAGSTGKTKSSTPAKKSTTAAKSSSSTASASAQVTGRKIAALRGQIRVLLAQAAALTAQAAKL